jgi:hypothetical protein
MSTTIPDQAVPEGPRSVSGAPNLPEGFTDTFASRFVELAEQAPEEMTAALTEFLAPYRDRRGTD